jgi:glycine/serine hydroxymethyltransferase
MSTSETPFETLFWGPDFAELTATDPEVADLVLGELDRVRSGWQLVASENFTAPAVLAALASTLSNKYAEGYPGRRYYGGCQQVDRAEELGQERTRALVGSPGVDTHVNLQPHSGASANPATYAALLQPGDPVLAMSLPHGGHLTHGSKVSFSGTWFKPVSYPVHRDTELIDKAVFPFLQGGPLMYAVAAKAVTLRECQQPAYETYARQVVTNAQALSDALAAERVRPVSGGTDTHLALLDLRELGVTGRDAGVRCDAARVTLDKNVIPYDPQPQMTGSGIRVGTPATTTQGMTEGDMWDVAALVGSAVRDSDTSSVPDVSTAVGALVARHPAHPRRG